MLENPGLPDEVISTCLQEEYGIAVAQITFLPLGADHNTAVYRVVAGDNTPYFLKLRSGPFDETSVALPRFLRDQGVRQIIAPLQTRCGQLRANLDEFKVILYPFVVGRDGYAVKLTPQQWRQFGAALKKIHTLAVPQALRDHIRQETYPARWRHQVRRFLERIEQDGFNEPVAARTAALMQARRAQVLDLVERAGELAHLLQVQSLPFVLCHSDIHAANLLVEAGGRFYIVDWDDPILAPKERDLMFIGGAQGFISRSPQEEETLFYRGYGQTDIDPIALAYYRYERIIVDIAVYCEQLLLTTEGGEDREQSLVYLTSNFQTGGTIEVACKSDKTRNVG